MIPPSNPLANYLAHQEEIDSAIAKVLRSGRYILGPEVASFENEFAGYIGTTYGVGVANGTDALSLALQACGVGPGDFVYSVSHTAIATVAAIELCGATPILVDIDPLSFTLSPNWLKDALENSSLPRAKAVIAVHLYGHPAEMSAINELAERYGLYVIEDCAQSHGASFGGKKTGALGHIAAFSFYPTKNLSAVGDGGMVTTNDARLAKQVRLLREYGWQERNVSEVPGQNSRLDELQAAVLRINLRYLEENNNRRKQIAQLYHALLDRTEITLPQTRTDCTHVFHQYVVRIRNRDALRTYLATKGIGTLVHYPVPAHLQPAYAKKVLLPRPLTVTELAASEVLSLPIYPQLSSDDIHTVASEITNWLEGTR